jgi:hypothetical protein
VTDWLQQHDLDWHTLVLRPDARGFLKADFAAFPVWTIRDDGRIVAETLLLRRDATRIMPSLTNAPPHTPLETLAYRKSQRYFVERSIQDAKSELGWDEFQALKYRAWEHHLALTIPTTLPYWNSMRPMSCRPSRLPTFATCCGLLFRSLNCLLNKRLLWSLTPSTTVPVPVVPVSNAVLNLECDFVVAKPLKKISSGLVAKKRFTVKRGTMSQSYPFV